MIPKFELGRDFCTMHLPPKFHHPTFTRLEVIVLTNKQTHTQTYSGENMRRSFYATTLGNKAEFETPLKQHCEARVGGRADERQLVD